MKQTETIHPLDGDARRRLLSGDVLPRIKALVLAATTYPDAHVDCAFVRETIALLQSLLPVTPEQDKQAQVSMAAQHHARADRSDARESFERLWDNCTAGKIGDYEAVSGAIERDRVVGVLDAWANTHRGWNAPACWPQSSGAWVTHIAGSAFTGSTPDAARAAAAKAIESREV